MLSGPGAARPLLGIAWSPDGLEIAAPTADGTTLIWDPTSGRETLRLPKAAAAAAVAWSSDSRYLTTVGPDGSVRQYFHRLPDLLELAASRVTRRLTPAELEQFGLAPTPTPLPVATPPPTPLPTTTLYPIATPTAMLPDAGTATPALTVNTNRGWIVTKTSRCASTTLARSTTTQPLLPTPTTSYRCQYAYYGTISTSLVKAGDTLAGMAAKVWIKVAALPERWCNERPQRGQLHRFC